MTSTSSTAIPRARSSSPASRGKTVATREPAQVGELGRVVLLGHRGLERARAEAEPQQLVDVDAPRSRTRSAPVIPQSTTPSLDVLGHVGGADEQHVDRRVPARERERALARLLRAEARVREQLHRRLAQPPLRRDGDRQPVGAGLPSRSSTSR